MDRPQLTSISLIGTKKKLSIRALVDITKIKELQMPVFELDAQHSPWSNIRFIPRKKYSLKIECLNGQHDILYSKEFTSHEYGLFQIDLPMSFGNEIIHCVKIFETSVVKGVECFLGHFFPTILPDESKIIISDFDKTLVETRYATAKEMIDSISKPISNFPTIPSSVQLLKSYIERDFIPFIVSASPHFYERSFRDWLYQNDINTSHIFLKDYRKIFSFFNEELTPKDIKHQGFYKLSTIVDILLMCQLPQEIVLIGDGFESDMLIYLVIKLIIMDKTDPYQLWKELSQKREFTLNAKQQSQFLLKVYELSNLSRSKWTSNVTIYIRCNDEIIKTIKSRDLGSKKWNEQIKNVKFYTA